ncbi:MAG: hemolysin family protein [Thermoflexales bacterium]|nr:hemolysin family protein [Thermoflexales bacterium]
MRAFFALARGALINMRKSRLDELEERGDATARVIHQLAENSSQLLATAELGATFGSWAAAAVAALDFVPLLRDGLASLVGGAVSAEVVNLAAYAVVLFLTVMILFVLGRLVPETLAARYAEPIALATVRPMQVASILLAPLVRLAIWLSNLLSMPLGGHRRANAAVATEEEIKSIVDAGQEEGVIEEEEKAMILSVLDFGDTIAREVMLPRIDIIALDVTAPLREALDTIIESGHSRVPLYRETIDDIVGMLYGKDLLRVLRDGDSPGLDTIARKAYFVPEAKPVNALLQEMQANRVHVAIVVDEYGGTAGLVTIEDILEEIVGEIQDEYDTEEPDYVALEDGRGYMLDAGMSIDDVNELMKSELPTDDSDTIAGFIMDQLGEIPSVGATVRYDGVVLEVLAVSDRRIGKVKATHADPKPAPESEEGDDREDAREERHA